jgi:hypothetical protein
MGRQWALTSGSRKPLHDGGDRRAERGSRRGPEARGLHPNRWAYGGTRRGI